MKHSFWMLSVVAVATQQAVGAELNVDKLNTRIPDLVFTGADGRAVPAQQLAGEKATVVVFLSFDCPVSAAYSPELTKLSQDYAGRGVKFVGVRAGDISAAKLAKLVKEYRLPFPVLRDPCYKAVDALKATITPEAFILDRNRVLRYRGRIDDIYYARLKKNAKRTRRDLKVALDHLLAGKAVEVPATRPIGCPVRVDDIAQGPVTTKYTYFRDVLPVLQKNCQECHRPGAVGPFALMTYKQAVNWADDIVFYTESRQMPPWKPVAGPHFLNSRTMSDDEIAILKSWAEGGQPKGGAKDAPKPRQFTDGWQLGKPDLVLEVKDDFHVAASGNDVFRCFVMPTGLTEDKYVVAMDVRPGNPRIVHHTLNFFDRSGQARKLAARQQAKEAENPPADHGPGYSVAMGVGFRPGRSTDGKPTFGGLGGWAPGTVPHYLPKGTGYFLPAGSDIVLQVHYHRNGKANTDRTKIGLYFSDKPVKQWKSVIIPGRFLAIPANRSDFKVKGRVWVERDCKIHSVMPHMHLLGKAVEVTMTPPGGEPRTLVKIDDWDYNWQETYWFKEPIRAKAGTEFTIRAVYDNSAENPNNPFDPPRIVTNGEQTTNEMLFGFLGATTDKPGRIGMRFTPPSK